MKKHSTISIFVLLVFILPASAWALLNWYEKKIQVLPVMGTKGHSIGNFRLLNQDGDTITTDDWKDKIIIADFFFSHCPTICPQMTKNLKKIQSACQLNPDLSIASFTVDPERDLPAQLQQYASKYEIDTHNWNFLTGDKKEIYKLARNSFMIVATDGDGGTDDFIHSEKLVLVDGKKRIRGYYDGTSTKEVNQLIADIKKLQNEN